jgi:hypothetical protein
MRPESEAAVDNPQGQTLCREYASSKFISAFSRRNSYELATPSAQPPLGTTSRALGLYVARNRTSTRASRGHPRLCQAEWQEHRLAVRGSSTAGRPVGLPGRDRARSPCLLGATATRWCGFRQGRRHGADAGAALRCAGMCGASTAARGAIARARWGPGVGRRVCPVVAGASAIATGWRLRANNDGRSQDRMAGGVARQPGVGRTVGRRRRSVGRLHVIAACGSSPAMPHFPLYCDPSRRRPPQCPHHS